MKEKRISGMNSGGWRRHADPPAWLDETLPMEVRRNLLDRAIRTARGGQQESAVSQGDDSPLGTGQPREPGTK